MSALISFILVFPNISVTETYIKLVYMDGQIKAIKCYNKSEKS